MGKMNLPSAYSVALALLTLVIVILVVFPYAPAEEKEGRVQYYLLLGDANGSRTVEYPNGKQVETIFLEEEGFDYAIFVAVPKTLAEDANQIVVSSNGKTSVLTTDPVLLVYKKNSPNSLAISMEFPNKKEGLATFVTLIPMNFYLTLTEEQNLLIAEKLQSIADSNLTLQQSFDLEEEVNESVNTLFGEVELKSKSKNVILFSESTPEFQEFMNILTGAEGEALRIEHSNNKTAKVFVPEIIYSDGEGIPICVLAPEYLKNGVIYIFNIGQLVMNYSLGEVQPTSEEMICEHFFLEFPEEQILETGLEYWLKVSDSQGEILQQDFLEQSFRFLDAEEKPEPDYDGVNEQEITLETIENIILEDAEYEEYIQHTKCHLSLSPYSWLGLLEVEPKVFYSFKELEPMVRLQMPGISDAQVEKQIQKLAEQLNEDGENLHKQDSSVEQRITVKLHFYEEEGDLYVKLLFDPTKEELFKQDPTKWAKKLEGITEHKKYETGLFSLLPIGKILHVNTRNTVDRCVGGFYQPASGGIKCRKWGTYYPLEYCVNLCSLKAAASSCSTLLSLSDGYRPAF